MAMPPPAAPDDREILPGAGKFIPLAEYSWEAHAELVKDIRNGLRFDPPTHLFDHIIAKKLGNRALYDPSQPAYAKYEGLRTNLEVLRNYLNAHMDAPRIATIAEALGDVLANDKWWKRPFTRWLSVDVAGVEGVGAGEMYKYLLEVQHKPALLQPIRAALNALIGIPDRHWRLPPLEATPFSQANLASPPPEYRSPAFELSLPLPQKNFAETYLSENRGKAAALAL